MTSLKSSGKWTLAETFHKELGMNEIAGEGTLFDSKITSKQTEDV